MNSIPPLPSAATTAPEFPSDGPVARLGWEQVFDLADGGFIILDAESRVVFWNAWMARHSEIDAAAAQGRTLRQLFGPHASARLLTAVEGAVRRRQSCLLSPSLNRCPLPLATTAEALGERNPILQSVSVKPFDSPDGRRHCLIQVSDMSSTALRERALRHQAIELAQAVEDLKLARDAATQANIAKSQFLTNMGHELRTPLNTIVGFSQLLQMHHPGELNDEMMEFITYIREAGESLLKMIVDILDLSKIEVDRLLVSLEPVEIERFVLGCIKSAKVQAQARQITLQYVPFDHPGAQMLTDPARLAQVMANLLSNAIKYNSPGGSVTVTVEITPLRLVRISVTDTGPGIPPEREPELFQSFNRLGAEFTEVPGAGIGLTLSRNLARLLGGDLGHRSTPGRGATFWVDVPVGEIGGGEDSRSVAPRISSPSPGSRLSRFAPFTLLYIENNPVNIRLLEALFATIPRARLVTARSADEGLRLAHSLRPTAIVLDIHLPRVSGFTMLERLRADPDTRAIPAIALSAYASPEEIERGLSAGFRRWLTKPLDMAVLMETLAQVMGTAS